MPNNQELTETQQKALISVDIEQAKKLLHLWLKEHHYHAMTIDGSPPASEWTYWTYSSRPFWSVFIKELSRGVLGFHIHDDGEVLLINREDK